VCEFHRRALHFHEQKREKDNVLLRQKMEPSFTTEKKKKTAAIISNVHPLPASVVLCKRTCPQHMMRERNYFFRAE
jgi:hypothetical protein